MRPIHLFLAFILALCFSSCSKEEFSPEVKYLEPGYFGVCYNMTSDEGSVVIRTQKQFDDYVEGKRYDISNVDCENTPPTAIDFDEYTLIGYFTSGGGCSFDYDRDIRQIGDKKVVYTIDATYSGMCLALYSSMNWALIPKIKNRTEVEFDVEVFQK